MARSRCASFSCGLLLVASVAGASPLAADDRVRLPNLRAYRDPGAPWVVRDGEIRARVRASAQTVSVPEATWTLDVDLDGPEGWRVTTFTLFGRGVTRPPVADGARRLQLRVRSTTTCSFAENREPIGIEVHYDLPGSQGVRTARLPLDARCLLGDALSERNARGVAEVAAKYLRDPVVDDLVSRAASLPLGSVRDEVARLRAWVSFGEGRVRPDPPDIAPGWRAGSAYVLSPTETVRFGGDCKDFSILIAAYLRRRGFETAIADTYGHVWVRAGVKGARAEDVDWVAAPSAEPPLSVVEVR